MTKGRQTLDGATVRRVQVMLDDATIERARVLGDGNVSQGIRRAIASLPTATRKTERGMTAAQEKERWIMRTYSELTGEHPGMFFWSCDAGLVEDDFGNEVRGLDVLIYETEDDMGADRDNALSIGRETVIDDREAMAVVREGDQEIGTWSMWTAPTRFLRELIEQAVEDGEAAAQDAEGCTVTAVRQ